MITKSKIKKYFKEDRGCKDKELIERASDILYNWLSEEGALEDDEEDVLEYFNILELLDCCWDKEERDIISRAGDFEIFDDEEEEEEI